ncbi:hypothetical protein [Phytopseudomonas seleniipraecipitans]|uniref:Uncharacterized protein n=1 Tax=Phytopseudomonas seleniipraecipitans TaxID=640205 RepID=A0A1G7JBV3_9GAMM|nr:hypothetical protein [Pseudomonas seleniipraecipitans]SDF22244.1 hypothetical protein SAMN05216381_1057 [Pseudomonas seleniipraecipitans]
MLSITVGGGWGRGAPADRQGLLVPWGKTQPADLGAGSRWQLASVQDGKHLASAWELVPAADLSRASAWLEAGQRDGASMQSGWVDVPTKDASLNLGWDHTIRPIGLRLRLIYNPKPARKELGLSVGIRRVNEYGPRYDAETALQDSLYVPGNGPLVFSFSGRPYFPSAAPHVYFDFRYVAETPRIQPADTGAVVVRWSTARKLNLGYRVPWDKARVLDGPLTGVEYVDYPGPVKPLPVPPTDPTILDTYMIANTVNLVVLPSRTPIEAKSLRIGLDADSFSWKFSADIFTKAALDLVRPDAEGAKEVELNINGWVWVLLVERYSRQLKFPAEAYSITGATRTQLLAAPYAPLRTGLNSSPITARQAADSELLNTGFTIEWDTENIGPRDWTFPSGALSYQSQTPMQVIARIAETVGAVVRPARDSDVLEIRPRYVVPPWEWGQSDAPVDRIIPPAMLTQLDGEWTPQPAWNACYVSGTSHGVSMLVRRAGTAGDNAAADVFDDWITGEEANRARGVHELSKGGDIEVVGVRLPLFHKSDDHGVGLVLPAMLCKVPEAAGAWFGACLSTDITAEGTGSVRVWQDLKLERHH